MKKSKDFASEDFIHSSEQFLKELGDVDSISEEFTDQADERISSGIRQRFISSEDEALDIEIDGYVEIYTSEDEMKAEASFYPASEGKKPIDLYDVENPLRSKGIVHGIDWDVIKKVIFECNTEQVPITDMLIANGTKPINEVPEHLIVEETLLSQKKSLDLESIRVDFRQKSPFVLVKKGDGLARLVPQQEGVQGATIFGKVLPYISEKISKIEPGKNTELEEDRIVASRDGRFEYNNRVFWVNEVLTLERDIDYRTGNIDFPGDVIINGQIKDGFTVKSGGSVYCNTTMDASEVISAKDLVVRLGVIGRKTGRVRVGGMMRAKFIENCYVEATDSVIVDVGILNSAVHAGNKVELKEKGVVVGGTIYAQNGIVATQLGTEMGPKTEIYCGTNYSVEQKLKWIRDKNVEIAFKLKQVERKLTGGSEGREKILELQQKLKVALHKLNEAAGSLIFQLDKNEKAEIMVRDQVFPGVYIEICHVSYIVSHSMRNVSFKLDKAKGKIIPEPLSLKDRII